MSSGKACGLDGLPAEIFKQDGRILVEKLTQLYSLIWQHEAVPKDSKDATIIHLYKRKGDHSICDKLAFPFYLLLGKSWLVLF